MFFGTRLLNTQITSAVMNKEMKRQITTPAIKFVSQIFRYTELYTVALQTASVSYILVSKWLDNYNSMETECKYNAKVKSNYKFSIH